jgi:hypothetical protein
MLVHDHKHNLFRSLSGEINNTRRSKKKRSNELEADKKSDISPLYQCHLY